MERTLVHTTRMPIRWGDMDAMGHVNNTVYFRFFEQARIEWFAAIDCVPSPAAGTGAVIINAHCTFLRQLKFPGDIEVTTFVAPLGRSSFETYHEIRRVDMPEVLVAEGGAKIVWTDYRLEKSIVIPDAIRLRILRPPDGVGNHQA
ncbi:acyl-CoA thioester hydrolase [Actimicrobium sp. GrIS 1.19]|uniref:acyl-CoA thioesterase n=1 Tax=Actimicrobium sp. GrIS 1.19 TaxID=3071708 RepID=UPI002DFFF736|nr:acyl-CoA thioester hydrolase [Actimicrobium sp. GrIS 1.19]